MTAYQSDEIRRLRRRIAGLEAQVRGLESANKDMQVDLLKAADEFRYLKPLAYVALQWVEDMGDCRFCGTDGIAIEKHEEHCVVGRIPEDLREKFLERTTNV